MTKRERVSDLLRNIEADSAYPAGYAAYFECFHRGEYYEAHDVLEQVWLGCRDGDALFYKGLIQIAGAFVHLRKNFENPCHPKHAARLHPAARLFDLGAKNLALYRPFHHGLDVGAVVTLAGELASRLRAGNFQNNPWHPSSLPRLPFPCGHRSPG